MRSVKTSGFLIAAAERTSLIACRSSSGTSANPVRLPALSSVIRFMPSLRTTAWLSSFLARVRDGALGDFMPAKADLRPGIVIYGEGWTGIGLDCCAIPWRFEVLLLLCACSGGLIRLKTTTAIIGRRVKATIPGTLKAYVNRTRLGKARMLSPRAGFSAVLI